MKIPAVKLEEGPKCEYPGCGMGIDPGPAFEIPNPIGDHPSYTHVCCYEIYNDLCKSINVGSDLKGRKVDIKY